MILGAVHTLNWGVRGSPTTSPDALSSSNLTTLAELGQAACSTLIIGEGSMGQGYCLIILLHRKTRQPYWRAGFLLPLPYQTQNICLIIETVSIVPHPLKE